MTVFAQDVVGVLASKVAHSSRAEWCVPFFVLLTV